MMVDKCREDEFTQHKLQNVFSTSLSVNQFIICQVRELSNSNSYLSGKLFKKED